MKKRQDGNEKIAINRKERIKKTIKKVLGEKLLYI